MKDAILIGTGGHSRSILSVLLQNQSYNNIYIYAQEGGNSSGEILGLEITGEFEKAFTQEHSTSHYFFAIGDNISRKKTWEIAKSFGLITPNLVAPTAVINTSIEQNMGNVFLHNSYVGPDVKVGCNNLINTSAVVEHEVALANHNHIAPNSTLLGRTRISNLVFIGAGSVVLPGLNVNSGVTLGAGSVLTKDALLNNSIYVGSPAVLKVSE